MSDHIQLVYEHSTEVQRVADDRILKGKSAVRIHRGLLGHRNLTGLHFWATGYCVSAVGLDEATIRKYIRDQDKIQQNQLALDLE